MKASQIIKADYERLGKDPVKPLTALTKLIQSKGAILLQEGDTVLVLINIGEKAVELHIFTQESPIRVAKAMIQFIKKIRNTDLETVYGSDVQKQTLDLLSKLDVEVMPSDNPKYKWMAKV
jgi:hypothetical protein